MHMTKKQSHNRSVRLEWLLNNVDLVNFDPFNQKHVKSIAELFRENGLAPKVFNRELLEQSAHTLLIKARKMKGLTWRDIKS